MSSSTSSTTSHPIMLHKRKHEEIHSSVKRQKISDPRLTHHSYQHIFSKNQPSTSSNNLFVETYKPAPGSKVVPAFETGFKGSDKHSSGCIVSSKSGTHQQATKMTPLQQYAITTFKSAMTTEKLQLKIKELYVKMALQVSSTDKNVISFTQIALGLNPDSASQARLWIHLANAHAKGKDVTSVEESIRCYTNGLKLTTSADCKAEAYLKMGKVFLARKQSGDLDKAIESFENGLKLDVTNLNLKRDLHLNMGSAYMQKKELLMVNQSKGLNTK
jgi:hypothetical protein